MIILLSPSRPRGNLIHLGCRETRRPAPRGEGEGGPQHELGGWDFGRKGERYTWNLAKLLYWEYQASNIWPLSSGAHQSRATMFSWGVLNGFSAPSKTMQTHANSPVGLEEFLNDLPGSLLELHSRPGHRMASWSGFVNGDGKVHMPREGQ